MTAATKVAEVQKIRDDILEFLAQKETPVGARTLIAEYCRKNDVDLALAETALLLLLNEGLIVTDCNLQLKKSVAAVA